MDVQQISSNLHSISMDNMNNMGMGNIIWTFVNTTNILPFFLPSFLFNLEGIEKDIKQQIGELAQQLSNQSEENERSLKTIKTVRQEMAQKDVVIERITTELRESTNHSTLAEKQYDGLKETIQRLQDDNDQLSKSNEDLVNRIVQEKEKSMKEMTKLMILNEQANTKIEMLNKLQEQEKKRFTWRSKSSKTKDDNSSASVILDDKNQNGRKFGGVAGVFPPSGIKHRIVAHPCQATCVRYDTAGGDIIATASEDSTVKVWSTGNGSLLKTLRGGSGQVMLGLDMNGDLTAGGGTDKTCRVWNTRTQRLVHQLVGHSQKVTSVRFFKGNSSAVLTASADRSMRVWDISRHTYRQNVTLRHSSTSNCLDMSYDGVTAVSGHLDGGVRFWDVRSGERTGEVSELHGGGVTSVNFNPNNNAEILTMGRDSTVKLVDVRQAGQELQTFQHADFKTDLSYSSCAISPDGAYAAAGSSLGTIFIWKTLDGSLERQLKGHDASIAAVAWDRGGSNGQQFASVDIKGNLLLWA